ncbi:kinase-like domain-containing protein [Cercophora newfieldiana]|uniref:Kinase-like domain-containing protein n=1 Tax=Cercophora newfieldiana TaxID=92897 RepID=A0AA40CX40_9PEZI|nr:kinase-like domain-containing protein [Cercophora newfieldiana]
MPAQPVIPWNEPVPEMKRRVNYYFDNYCRGQVHDEPGDPHPLVVGFVQTPDKYRNNPLPYRQGPWPGVRRADFRRNVRPQNLPRSRGGRRRFAQVPGMRDRNFNIINTKENNALRRIKFALRRQHMWPELKFVKILGYGGQGVAALVVHHNSNNAQSVAKHYVLKTSYHRSQDADICEEGEKTLLLRGAKHIVQKCEPEFASAAFLRAYRHPRYPGYLMPYMRRGGLDKLIIAASVGRLRILPRTMWLIFERLYRMVLATRYPPQWWTDFNADNAAEERRETLPTQADETAQRPLFRSIGGAARRKRIRRGPAMPGPPKYMETEGNPRKFRMVHLDIDPFNIFVGDYDPIPAGQAPGYDQMIPLADFGLAQYLGDLDAASWDTAWSARQIGKPGWRAPEQFSPEWFHIDGPAPPGAPYRVAGNYDWHTNLWSIGMVMWCLITGCLPPDGPMPELGPTRQPPANGVRRSRRVAESQAPRRWTYGDFLCADPYDRGVDDQEDMQLRTLVMRCLMDDPADRPSLHELETIFADMVGPAATYNWDAMNSPDNVRYGPPSANQNEPTLADKLWSLHPPAHRIRRNLQLRKWLDDRFVIAHAGRSSAL